MRYDLSVQAIENQVGQGNFPPPDIRRGPRYVRWSLSALKAYERMLVKGPRVSAPRFAQQWQQALTPEALDYTDPHGKVAIQTARLLEKTRHREPRQGRQPGPRTAAGRMRE